jgi:NadR type nicotinamide-nucleotide adenylyltransferase
MTETGLYVGKFAPLHKGHQYVIETALSEVDKLYVIIYDEPTVTDIPLSTRAEWIRNLYPQVTVIQAWNGPSETGYTEEIKTAHEQYIDSILPADISIDKYYSSEPYGEHMSEFFNAVDRRVDEDRETYPISGTKIRKDPYHNRKYISHEVYKDLITNVVFLGGPSTGKSTLTKKLAEEFDTAYMPEFGREFWEENAVDRRLTTEQLVELAETHISRENDAISGADEYLFTDTNALTTATFSQYYHSMIPSRLWDLTRNTRQRYDIHIVCGTDIPYDDTEDRSGEANRQRLQKHTISLLNHFNIPYYTVTGTVQERINKVKKILESEDKWDLKRTV